MEDKSKFSSTFPSVCIMGGGIMGLQTAYFLQKFYNVTIIEPNDRVEGASEKNAGTITTSMPVWTTKNWKQSVKDNINFPSRWWYGVDTVFCLVKPSLILDREFRAWVWKYLKCSKNKDEIERVTRGNSELFFYTY